MKKKSFFRSFNAKTALFAVMVSGALLTGCYKDDGLDVEGPTGETTLPAATYTLNGTVIDGKTGEAIEGATVTVTPSTAFTAKSNSFTATVAPGDVTISVTKDGYKPVSKIVTINAIAAGQSAVYSQIISMVSTAVPPVSKVAKYDVDAIAFSEDNVSVAATAKLYDVTGATEVAMQNVAAGAYKLVVTPADQNKYDVYTSIVTLDEVVVPADFEGNLKKVFVAYLTEKVAPVENVTYSYSFRDLAGTSSFNVQSASLTIDGEVVATIAGYHTIKYTLPKADAEGHEFAVVYTYLDEAGVERYGRAAFAPGKTTGTANIDTSATSSPSTEVGVGEDGKLVAGSTVTDGGTIIVDNNIIATIDGTPIAEPISIQRKVAEELEDETALRVYEGTPAGTVFSEPIKIAFKDVYGTELGDLTLMYKEGDNWVEDTKGGSVTTGASTYTMNVKHFSTFKAVAKMTTVEAPSTTDVDTKTIEVNKKNDADDKITVKVKMQAVIGTEFETSIVDAVKKAGFTNTMAIQKIAEMVESRLLALGLSNTGITEYEQTQDFEIAGRTAFVSYDRARTYKLESFTFTVNGKNIVINTKTAVKTELTNPILTYYGHGHTHGGDNLSGGGIIDAE